MRSSIFIILTFLTIVSVGSCISKKKLVYTKYYLIEPPPEQVLASDNNPDSDLKLEISSIRIGPAYATTKIVNRNRSNEIVYFGYHEWAVLPNVSIEEFASKYFRHTQYFEEVSTNIFGGGKNFRLKIEVSRIEMLNLTDETLAHLVVNYTYTDASTGKVILTHQFDESSQMQQKDVNLLAISVSNLLWGSLEQVYTKMVDFHNSKI